MLRNLFLLLSLSFLISSCASVMKAPLITSCSWSVQAQILKCYDETAKKAFDLAPASFPGAMVCRPSDDEALLLDFCGAK